MEPASLWILVRFAIAEPQWELGESGGWFESHILSNTVHLPFLSDFRHLCDFSPRPPLALLVCQPQRGLGNVCPPLGRKACPCSGRAPCRPPCEQKVPLCKVTGRQSSGASSPAWPFLMLPLQSQPAKIKM